MHTYLKEDIHVLPGSILFEHRIGVFPHHVVDGLDYVYHLLEGDMEGHTVGTMRSNLLRGAEFRNFLGFLLSTREVKRAVLKR